MKSKFPDEVRQYIEANYKGVGPTEMSKRIWNEFSFYMSPSQTKTYYKNHRLNSGLSGRFEKGRTPENKGKKGIHHQGSEKGWFKRGHEPHNKKPVGAEKFDGEYWFVKIADPNKWKAKHILVWEEAHKQNLLKGTSVIFLDGNRENFEISNLRAVERKTMAVLNRWGLRANNKELTEVGISIAKLKSAISKRSKNEKESSVPGSV